MAKIERRPWYRRPLLTATPALVEVRNTLREKNLHDTEDGPLTGPPPLQPDAPEHFERTFDGTYNDREQPRMGCVHARFGRNVPLADTKPDVANLLTPNPRLVSERLMGRDSFQAVPFLNLLAASWIQFQTHDWFSHGRNDGDAAPIEVPIEAGDSWPARPMKVPHTRVDPTFDPASGKAPAYRNEVTHWWDGSQIYGVSAAENAALRTGVDGKLKIQADGKLPVNPATGIDLTGFIDNWWIGLSMLHSLFTLEHNAICDMLKAKNPGWDDAKLFAKARLINAAILAKIHTVEWTPAILPNRIVEVALRTNWSGPLGRFSEILQKIFERLNDSELLGGIVGSPKDHHAAPYSLTEEFVSVYRMHALMPDEFAFHSLADGGHLATHELPAVSGQAARAVLGGVSLTDLFYSFGSVLKPGMIRLHNYPTHLRNLRRDDGSIFDLATVDILRDRERGVPRYNRFRELLGLPRVATFEKLTDNPVWREEIRQVYAGDIDMVDTQVGLMCEPLEKGFGFSITAFYVFVLMASRRLKSDRFFTRESWNEETYTKEGLRWIEKAAFGPLLTRHFPALAPALEGVDNAFAPWRRKVNGHWEDPA
jgi:hypothetical protein